jgi:hypothetical protein
MKLRFYLLTLVIAGLSSMSLYAQDQYEGEWPSGEGILYSQEKGLVMGEFSKGNPEGICVCYLPNGDVYWGEFRKGKATGHGRIYRDNGIVIAGQYRNGRYHGIDTLYRKDGSVLVARYRNGKLKERIFDSKKEKVDKVFHKPEYPQMDFRRSQENFLREQEKYEALAEGGATVVIEVLPEGKHTIAGKEVAVKACGMRALHFVSRKTGHELVRGFEPYDFRYWYDENEDMITPILRTTFLAEGATPILTSGNSLRGSAWGQKLYEALACAEITTGRGKIIINQVDLKSHMANPAARIFAGRLYSY